MRKLEIFTQDGCSYCVRAKMLYLSKKKMFDQYFEYNISQDSDSKTKLLEMNPEAKTVPQIFINDNYVDGYSEFGDWIDNHYSGS